MRSSESPYEAAVSMWLTPCASSRSSVRSASACETLPSAAAPKIVRLLSWPVMPNGAVAIMRATLAERRQQVHARPIHYSRAGDERVVKSAGGIGTLGDRSGVVDAVRRGAAGARERAKVDIHVGRCNRRS